MDPHVLPPPPHFVASVSMRPELNQGSNHRQPHHILKNNDTYTVVNKTGSLQHQPPQPYNGLSAGLRKAGSYRDVDQMERETVSAMRVSPSVSQSVIVKHN